MTLKLYGGARSRASIIKWYLEEKNIPYEFILLDLQAGDQQKPEYVKLNPNKVVPTLIHDETVVIESNVICEYLDDAFEDRPVRPSDPAKRAQMRLWTKQIDEGVHAATGIISNCIAFRHQHLQNTCILYQQITYLKIR